MSHPRPLPVVDHLSAPFWEGCKAHELKLQRCRTCGASRFPAGPVCLQCRSAETEWIVSKGKGRIYSWIVVQHPVPADIYAQDVPYVVALVELDEGVRMPTNIVGCAPDEVTAGMPVQVTFCDVNSKISLPQFTPSRQER